MLLTKNYDLGGGEIMKKARNILVVTLMLLSVLSFGSVANTYAKYTSTA